MSPWPAPSERARIVPLGGDLPANAEKCLRAALAADWPTAIATFASSREVDSLVLWLDDGKARAWARWERADGKTWEATQAVHHLVRAVGISDVLAWCTKGTPLPGAGGEATMGATA